MATTRPATKLMTTEEFMRITRPGRFDLLYGKLIEGSPAGGQHGEVASEVVFALTAHAHTKQPGKVYTAEAAFELAHDPDVTFAPDVAFVRAERLPPLHERVGAIKLAPDLAVEIVSPSDRMTTVRRKVAAYLAHGTAMVWVIEPRRRTVTVHRPGREPQVFREGDELDGEDVLPGFRLRVEQLFT